MNPKEFLKNKEKMITMHLERLSFLDLDTLDQNIPVIKKNVFEGQINSMKNYIKKNGKMLNKSQKEVFQKVVEMPQDDILLI